MTKLGTALYNATIKAAPVFAKNKWLFYLLVFTWGSIMTYIGCIVSLSLIICGFTPNWFYMTWYFNVGKSGWGGIEMGLPFITDIYDTNRTKCHELGHSVQNAIFGPFAIFISFIPSAFRYWYREFKYNRKGKFPPTKYDDIWFEKSATDAGKLIKEYFDTKKISN